MLLLLALLLTQPSHAEISHTQAQKIFDAARIVIPAKAGIQAWIPPETGGMTQEEAPKPPRTLKNPLPAGVEPKISKPGPKIGFSAGFLIGELIPMIVMQTPYVGKPVGWLLYAIFLPAALIAGAIGALIGELF